MIAKRSKAQYQLIVGQARCSYCLEGIYGTISQARGWFWCELYNKERARNKLSVWRRIFIRIQSLPRA